MFHGVIHKITLAQFFFETRCTLVESWTIGQMSRSTNGHTCEPAVTYSCGVGAAGLRFVICPSTKLTNTMFNRYYFTICIVNLSLPLQQSPFPQKLWLAMSALWAWSMQDWGSLILPNVTWHDADQSTAFDATKIENVVELTGATRQ